MYNISDAYRAYIDSSTVRKAKSKILVDGVEYSAQLKKYPSISFQGEFIGSFPAMSCTFEIYNIGVDLVGKEIEVYRGLEIDGATEWVPLGKFTAAADGVKSSNTGDSITYTGYDRATRFDVEYTALDLTYPTTIGAFAQELAFRRGVGFDTTPFPCCDIILDGPPNIPVGTSEREIIRQMAELGGGNAWITRAGDLCISQPKQTAEQIRKRKYASLSSKENKYGGINTVVLGKADYEDDIVYQNAEAVAVDGVIEWRLENNIFAEVDREGFAEYIGDSYIIGLSYTPFEVSGFVDDWYLDPFDMVEIEDKSGAFFSTVILTYNTADRIKSTIAAGTPGEMLTNYEIAGTTGKKLSYVLLQVDHINNKIESIAVDVSGMKSSISQTAEQIELKVSYGEVISAINQSAETISIDASKINLTGYITASDLSAEGETVIHGGRIDTDSLYVKHLDAAEGNFTDLTAASGGTLRIGNWEFLSNGLEYDGGVFDLEYSGGVAHLSGTAPMQVGPYSNGVANNLTLYGTKIYFGSSTTAYGAVMDSYGSYNEICFRPYSSDTGNIGTANYVWDSGHFRNLYIYNYLTIENLTANSNVTSETLNVGSAARVSGTMVIGSSSASQPSRGLLISTGTSSVCLETTGLVKVGNMAEGDSSDIPVRWGSSSKRLMAYSSSKRYKTNIEDLPDDLAECLLNLRPVTYNRIKSGHFEFGLIAEEVEQVTPLLCTYSTQEDGSRIVEGVNYELISVLCARKIQDLYKEMAELKTEIERMKTA